MWINQLEKSKDVIAQSQAVAGERDLAVHYVMDLGVHYGLHYGLHKLWVNLSSLLSSSPSLPAIPAPGIASFCLNDEWPTAFAALGACLKNKHVYCRVRVGSLQGEDWFTAGKARNP